MFFLFHIVTTGEGMVFEKQFCPRTFFFTQFLRKPCFFLFHIGATGGGGAGGKTGFATGTLFFTAILREVTSTAFVVHFCIKIYIEAIY